MAKFNPIARHKARRYALQALYQWQLTGNPSLELELQFTADYDLRKVDQEYFKKIIHDVPLLITQLDEYILPVLADRIISEVTPVEITILRISTYELAQCLDIPYRVIINEGLELAKTFGAQESHKFINGVLDRLARQLRSHEINMPHPPQKKL